jgi:hypothetical protein
MREACSRARGRPRWGGPSSTAATASASARSRAVRHDVHPPAQAAPRRRRRAAGAHHRRAGRSPSRAVGKLATRQAAVRRHRRQPDGPDDRRLPEPTRGRRRCGCSRSTSRASGRSTAHGVMGGARAPESGRHLVLYRAGRTAAGAAASASHTASIAGDYVGHARAGARGGRRARRELEAFEDLVMTFTRSSPGRPPAGAARRGVERRVRVRGHGRQRSATSRWPRFDPATASALEAARRGAHRWARRRPQPARPDADGGRRGVRRGRAARARLTRAWTSVVVGCVPLTPRCRR